MLDWLLPGEDGIAVGRAIRARDAPTPILILTARDRLADRVNGLGTGADELSDVLDNLADAHVSHLRKKIDRGGIPLIQTVRGFGYRLGPPDDSGGA